MSTTPWAPTTEAVLAAIAKGQHNRQNMNGIDPNWQRPTGDTYRFVTLVSPEEMTCLGCGETFVGKYCHRCGLKEDGAIKEDLPPAVRTLDYLKPGEYKL